MPTTNNNPNLYGDRTGLSLATAAIGALAGWAAGAELALWALAGRMYGVVVLWQVVSQWGAIPVARWGVWGYLPAASALLAAGGLGVVAWRFLTVPSERHIRGYVLYHSPQPIAAALRPGKNEQPGVLIHPAVQVSQSVECRHTLLIGGSGGGKTSILWPIIQQVQARGDKLLIFDSKGDFTEKLGGDFALLSPTDARSRRWVVGRDIRTRLDAQALGETLIRENEKEPMWSQGSRALLVGLVTDLQARHGEKWGMAHLAHAAASALSDFETLKDIIAREDPMSLSLLGGEDAAAPSRTTMSFLIQLASALTNVINLGVATHDQRDNPGWSVRSWLVGRQPPVAVVGFRESAKGLSQALDSSLLEQTVRQILDMPDSAPDQRRIWLIVDEAPRVGKVPSITDALTAARSKGLRVVLGIQSLAQVRETYTRDTATVWAGQTATKIICQTTAPEDQKWCSDLLGDREVERYQHQVSQQTGSDAGGQHSASWQRAREPVLLPASFGQELRITPGGPRALLMAAGEAALLDWLFPVLTKHRPAFVEARWTRPGYQRPTWGKAPPDVPAAPASLSETGKQTTQKKPAPQPPVPVVTVPVSDADLPLVPTKQRPESAVDHVAQSALEHVLSAVAPGAALAARVLGLARDAAPPAGAARPGQQTVTVTERQGQDERTDQDQEQEE